MKPFSNSIKLVKNSRGVYCIDTIMGCASGIKTNKKGCYDDCYAFKIARAFGKDFSKSVKRKFDSYSHLGIIQNKINSSDVNFVRIGNMGDPSEDWDHTISVCEKLRRNNQINLFISIKPIVIITKHFNVLTKSQLNRISKLNIIINTSISVLDSPVVLEYRINQYEILKKYCKSILRIVSCSFNTDNETGAKLSRLQEYLFSKYNMIDTIFRPNTNNKLVKEGIININKRKFLNSYTYASVHNRKTFFGKCDNCIEKCGINN